MNYIKSNDGVNAEGGLRESLPAELVNADKPTRMAAGWYDFVPSVPQLAEDEVAYCVGFQRSGEDFTGVYEVRKVQITPKEEIATEADKDAALSRLGVDMTEE